VIFDPPLFLREAENTAQRGHEIVGGPVRGLAKFLMPRERVGGPTKGRVLGGRSW